jgi:HlyD family secretion protein
VQAVMAAAHRSRASIPREFISVKKVLLLRLVLVVGAAVAAGTFWFRRDTGVSVTVEAIRARNLEAFVSAAGKIQPKRQVNISANQMGRVTRLAVREGERVKAGQFLLEIDPRSLVSQLERGEATVAAADSALQRARSSVEQSRANLELSRQNLARQQELWKEGLTTRQEFERAENEVTIREADYKAAVQEIETNEQRIKQERASLASTRHSLSEVIISSPMDGIVSRRYIEEGETAVVGTMNNAGSQLLTIADMSQLEAELEVDETDIPLVSLGQQARVRIDAVPNRTFRGRVTEIGNSPVQASTTASTGRQATTFKVVVTLDEQVPDVRPGFTCTAEIVTATREEAVAVPIQALTVRELLYDPSGQIVRKERPRESRGVEPTVGAYSEPPEGHERKETEGVFVIRAGLVEFTPVEIGIAGERYFEVISGLSSGDRVVTGPFASVRGLADGEAVQISESSGTERQ